MKNQVLEALESRRSIRSYTDQPVEAELLEAILRAGTFAPTAMGRQDPIIVAVSDAEATAALRRLGGELRGTPEKDPYYAAPVILAVFAPDTYLGNQDGCAVTMNLLHAANALGLGACWINRAREIFQTEEGRALQAQWASLQITPASPPWPWATSPPRLRRPRPGKRGILSASEHQSRWDSHRSKPPDNMYLRRSSP